MSGLPNDISKICDELAKTSSSVLGFSGSKKKAARTLAREPIIFEKGAADGAAATASTYLTTPAWRAPCDGRLLGAYFIAHAALTADPTNNAILSIDKSDGLGGAATVMATATTTAGGTGNLAAGVTKPLPLNATVSATRFTAGQLISFDIAKGGTGVVVPAGTFQLDIEFEGQSQYEVV